MKDLLVFTTTERIIEKGIVYYVTTSKFLFSKVQETWKNSEGQISRKDKPAVIHYHEDGLTPKKASFYNEGNILIDDFCPSIVEYFTNGNIKKSTYFSDLKRKKTVIEYFNNGKKKRVLQYKLFGDTYKLGLSIMDDLPSVVEYDEYGYVVKEDWYFEGKNERFDIFKPISIRYNGNRKVPQKKYIDIIQSYSILKDKHVEDFNDEDIKIVKDLFRNKKTA
jgi:hypothetical protein